MKQNAIPPSFYAPFITTASCISHGLIRLFRKPSNAVCATFGSPPPSERALAGRATLDQEDMELSWEVAWLCPTVPVPVHTRQCQGPATATPFCVGYHGHWSC